MLSRREFVQNGTFYTIVPYSNRYLDRNSKSASYPQLELFRAVLECGEDGDEGIDLLLHLHGELPLE